MTRLEGFLFTALGVAFACFAEHNRHALRCPKATAAAPSAAAPPPCSASEALQAETVALDASPYVGNLERLRARCSHEGLRDGIPGTLHINALEPFSGCWSGVYASCWSGWKNDAGLPSEGELLWDECVPDPDTKEDTK